VLIGPKIDSALFHSNFCVSNLRMHMIHIQGGIPKRLIDKSCINEIDHVTKLGVLFSRVRQHGILAKLL
jgi:hypothetical protein